MGSAEKPPGTPQAEEAPPVETPADGSLPPVTPPKEQSGAEAADDELSMRQPGFTSPLIKMGARTVEKLEREDEGKALERRKAAETGNTA